MKLDEAETEQKQLERSKRTIAEREPPFVEEDIVSIKEKITRLDDEKKAIVRPPIRLGL